MKPLFAGLAALALAVPASAGELLTNGDFETGTFAGWSPLAQVGSSGSLFVHPYAAGSTPISTQPMTANAAGGVFYALTDQGGFGAYSLYQAFVVPLGATSVTLKYDLVANNWAGATFIDPIGLDYSGPPNQHARVDLLTGAAGAFSTAAGDVLGNFYLGDDGSAPPYAWRSYSFDITSLVVPGGTYAVRFGEVDNQLFFNLGVDNVSVWAALVPEPATWAMLVAGFGLVGAAVRRRRAAIA